MRVKINGETHEINGVGTLAELITQLGMASDRVAVELDRDIVPRTAWHTTPLKEGAVLEIVHFVGGGAQ